MLVLVNRSHHFFVYSVDRWLKSHNAKCPLCKKDIREDWEDEDEEVWDPVTGKWVREDGFSGEEGSEGESGEGKSTNHVDT